MRDGIQQQAIKMTRTSSSYLLNPEINDCVNITVPEVDRPRKISMKNIVGVIVDIKKNHGSKLYNVATVYGCIRPLLSRNQFEMCRQKNVIDIETVDREREVSIREIAAAEEEGRKERPSSSFCRCATDLCRSLRCMCRRRGLSCTGRCQHGRDPRTGRVNQEIAARFICNNM